MTEFDERRSRSRSNPARKKVPTPPLKSSPEESERDLPLKVQMRRLFWSMGCSTTLDVKLRAYVSGDQRGPGWQEFTDLDVLAIGFSPGGAPQLTLADCKTVQRRAIERMFWVRGVADFFSANDAYLVRSASVPAAARVLSTRLGIGVLDPDDFEALSRTFVSDIDLSGPLRCLFDLETVRRQTENTAGLDRRLDSLVDFLRFDYWIYEPYRNLTQVVAHLAEAVQRLEPENPRHLSLFFEAAWLYSYALAHATHHIRTSRMASIPTAARTLIAGGELALREKGQLADLLHQAGIAVDRRAAVLPPYADMLTELLTRLLARPTEMGNVLRYSEFLTTASLVDASSTVRLAFGDQHVRPVAAKLLADICGFLVTAAGLKPGFRSEARSRLITDLTGGDDSPVNSGEGAPAQIALPILGPIAEDGSLDVDNSGLSSPPNPVQP